MSKSRAENFAAKNNAIIFETSAKENIGVDEIFKKISEEVSNKCPGVCESVGQSMIVVLFEDVYFIITLPNDKKNMSRPYCTLATALHLLWLSDSIKIGRERRGRVDSRRLSHH